MNASKKADKTIEQVDAKTMQQLIFSRKIAHKTDIPGSGQWRMIEDSSEGCWVCEREIYSLIFWNESIGKKLMNKIEDKDQKFINCEINKFNRNHNQIDSSDDRPIIYGQFTNWKPKRMINIKEYCHRINPERIDVFEEGKQNGLIRPECLNITELNDEEIEYFDQAMKEYLDSYNRTWKGIIQKSLNYKQPNIVNAQLIEQQFDNATQPLYVFPTFMRSGRQYYSVETHGQNSETFVHSCISRYRTEEIKPFKKVPKNVTILRKFKKETSVFRSWKQDDDFIYNECLIHDFSFWKIPKFIKDENDQEDLEHVVKHNFPLLKNLHIYNSANSNFPNCSLLAFSKFAKQCDFVDANLPSSQIDREFIATNFELNKGEQDGNDDRQLIRFEFIELLVRIANAKYLRPGKALSIGEAFQHILDNNLSLSSQNAIRWQGFRDKSLWNLEMNDLFEGNLENLRKVYDSYLNGKRKQMTLKDALNLFGKLEDMAVKDLIYCLGMSKMTVCRENSQAKQHEHLQFVELLEMIGRVAEMRYLDSELETHPLHFKVEIVLDDLFENFGLTRYPAIGQISHNIDASDTDY